MTLVDVACRLISVCVCVASKLGFTSCMLVTSLVTRLVFFTVWRLAMYNMADQKIASLSVERDVSVSPQGEREFIEPPASLEQCHECVPW